MVYLFPKCRRVFECCKNDVTIDVSDLGKRNDLKGENEPEIQ